MSEQGNIPTLTDLIEKGIEITMSDLGLDDDLEIVMDDSADSEIDITEPDLSASDPFEDNPVLEQTIRRIIDEHMELAWQEIKLVIRQQLKKS
jgi:hypothetical protein